MKVVSVALAATYSAVLSLQGLDTNGPIGFSLSVGQTASDIFELYGTLDAAAVDNTNAQLLGRFTGSTLNLPKGIADQARDWPFVLIRRVGGSTAGTLFVAGNPAASPAVVSVAAPVVSGGYSALLTLTTLGAKNIRIGGSRTMLVTDVFNVYLSDDPSLASATGAFLAGTITGGGGTNFVAVDASGFNYAIVQRATTSTTLTAGNIIAAGVSPSEGGGVLNLTTLAVGDTAVNGPIGALTAAATVDIYSSFLLTQTTAGITAATLPNPTDTTPGKLALVMNNDASTAPIQMYGVNIGIGAVQWFAWEGSAWGSTRLPAIALNASNTSAQVIADGAVAANVTGWTEVTDTFAAFDPVTGLFTVPQTGFYIINAQLQWANTAAAINVLFQTSIAVGGAIVRTGSFENPVGALTATRTVSVSAGLQLTAAQVVSIQAFLGANGGTDIALTNSALQNFVSIVKVA